MEFCIAMVGGIIFLIIISSYNKKTQQESLSVSKNAIDDKLKELSFDIEKKLRFEYNTEMTAAKFSQIIIKELLFDFSKQKLAFCDYNADTVKIIDLTTIIDCELVEDNSTIIKGGVGRAVVGGVLAGGVGAIVGAGTRNSSDIVNSLAVRIIMNDNITPLFMIDLIDKKLKRDDPTYKKAFEFANQVYSSIFNIVNNNKEAKNTITQNGFNSVTDQFRELSKLKDEGILSSKEFEDKKKELLSKI